jgi:hypothetical protein
MTYLSLFLHFMILLLVKGCGNMEPQDALIAAAVTKEIAKDAYQDTLQPAMQEIGKNAHTVSKLITIALTPVSGLVWGYEQIKAFVQSSLEKRLKNVPPENIIPPDTSIAGPTLEALRYSSNKEDLREMFANLLATAMDSATASTAHPSFVEIIKQISPDEAKIISLLTDDISKPIIAVRAYTKDVDHYAIPLINFSMLPYLCNCIYPEQGPSYLDNIHRLGLAEITYESYHTYPNAYEPLERHPTVSELISRINQLDKRPEIKRGAFTRTNFGKKFYDACILER